MNVITNTSGMGVSIALLSDGVSREYHIPTAIVPGNGWVLVRGTVDIDWVNFDNALFLVRCGRDIDDYFVTGCGVKI